MAIARGTIEKAPCVVCSRLEKVTAYIAEPTKWRDVVWICRDHRQDEIARRTALPDVDPVVAWQIERETALAAIELLQEAERTRLYAIAARGPAGVRLTPEAPLFTIQLIRTYQASRAHAEGSS